MGGRRQICREVKIKGHPLQLGNSVNREEYEITWTEEGNGFFTLRVCRETATEVQKPKTMLHKPVVTYTFYIMHPNMLALEANIFELTIPNVEVEEEGMRIKLRSLLKFLRPLSVFELDGDIVVVWMLPIAIPVIKSKNDVKWPAGISIYRPV